MNGFPRRNRRNPGDINYNQRVALDLYVNMYNTTLRQIDSLYENLNEIKHNIDYLVGLDNDYIRGEPISPEIVISRTRGERRNSNSNSIVSNNYNTSDSSNSNSSDENNNINKI
jgi:hypothetical protein